MAASSIFSDESSFFISPSSVEITEITEFSSVSLIDMARSFVAASLEDILAEDTVVDSIKPQSINDRTFLPIIFIPLPI